MDIEKLSLHTIEALENRGHSESAIKKMTPEMAFDEFCEWHGLISWGSTLREIYENAKQADQ